MHIPVKLALRFVALVVVAGLIAAVVSSSPGPARSPYASSLSGLAVGAVYAASACGNTGCNRLGHCSKLRGYNCRFAEGECQQTAC